MFQMIRFAHIADSCVNCGQCSDVCPMNIDNSLFMHAQQVELEKMFGHTLGKDMELQKRWTSVQDLMQPALT